MEIKEYVNKKIIQKDENSMHLRELKIRGKLARW